MPQDQDKQAVAPAGAPTAAPVAGKKAGAPTAAPVAGKKVGAPTAAPVAGKKAGVPTAAPVAGKKASVAADNETEILAFPPPKYVVTIVSPRVIQLHELDASLDEWKEFEESAAEEDSATLLNLHVLLVSLLNRLLRARLFPRRAVHSYITPAVNADDHDWVIFSILTPATVLPMLLSKCEHFGVGNLVGLVYAVPLETCVLPLLTNQTAKDEEEEGLLTVPPSQSHATPNMAPSTATSTTTNVPTTGPPSLPESSVMVMTHKRSKTTPNPTVLRPVVSDTIEEAEKRLAETDAASSVGTGSTLLLRSSSHPDVLQTSAPEEKKNKKGGIVEKQKETPLLEIIPEAKAPIPSKEVEMDSSGGSKRTAAKKADGPNKSVLIEKVLDARKEWLATASRIRVEQVAEEVSAAATLSWDYLLFVVCAAAIAATGLATDSSVTVLASMLVSPIMGPILAVTFGTMIRRPMMIRKALRNEAVSLLLCILVGACGGLVVWWTRLYESSAWPANEMTARGDPTGLAAGVLIALPSGMATALSTLGKNSSGLVGVAISLSLLPPAVNAGLCWMFALLEESRFVEKEPDDDTNYWRVGSTSFGLTLVNIICIWLAGVFTFWLKEVAPVEHKSAFWARDLKIARQKPKEPGAGKIKDGLQAAIDLKKTYNVEVGDDRPAVKTPRARRRVSAPTSKWEDALLFDRNPARVPPPERIQRASSDGILKQAEALGGIDNATDILFNNSLFRVGGDTVTDESETAHFRNGMDLSYHPDSVPPEDIYQEILWQRLRNPKM